MNKYFNNKKYGIYENEKSDDEFDKFLLNDAINDKNNGICNKIFFSSNLNYINFLNHFAMYNNNFININELFTSLLLLGSQTINSEEFLELIKDYLPENKKQEKKIYLTKEEFIELPMWFEKDDYLNALKDENEKENYLNISDSEENKENKHQQKPLKINSIKEALFEINSEDGLLELNKILELLNKLNNISISKKIINDRIESEKSDINQKSKIENLELNNKKEEADNTPIIGINSNDINVLKLNLDSKASSRLESRNKSRVSESKKKKKINIFNILFN